MQRKWDWGLLLLLLAVLSLALYPAVGMLALVTAALLALSYIALPKLRERARELELLSRMRNVALLFSANLVAVKSFEKALERTLKAIPAEELRESLRRYLLTGSLEGRWADFFSFVRENVRSGKKESVKRALSYYLKALENHLQQGLENTVEPIKVFIAIAVLLPIMVMVAIPIFYMFSGRGGEEAIAYFFAFLLPLAYLLFLLYVKHVKPKLSTTRLHYPLWAFLLLPLAGAAALLMPPLFIPVAGALILALVALLPERVVEEKPWQALHPTLAKMALYLKEGYSFERAAAKAGLNPFQPLPQVVEVVRESADRGAKEGGEVAEELAELLEKAEEMEASFRERLEEGISTLRVVEYVVMPLVGGATLAFTLALFQYLQRFQGEGFLEGLVEVVDVKLLIWGFTMYILEAVLIIHLLKEVLEGREGWSVKGAGAGLLLFALSFGVLYLFIAKMVGVA